MSNQKTTDPAEEIRNESSFAAADVEVGTQADVEEIMKKYDRESNTRPWVGVPAIVIKVILAAFSMNSFFTTATLICIGSIGI